MRKKVSAKPAPATRSKALCLLAAKDGVKTSREFAATMSALMSDILHGRIDARTANAACNAGGKLLRIVELQHKYGSVRKAAESKVLTLSY